MPKIICVENGNQIIRNLKEKDFNGADILIWVMPEEATEDLLNALNNFRELFYKVKIPNLVFYNQAFFDSVIRKAPDFWRYRGNYYELKEERGIVLEELETSATPLSFSYQNKEELLRRKRINEYLLKRGRNKEEKAKILNELGITFCCLGELEKALEYYEDSLKLYEELGDKEGIAANYVNIGIVCRIMGELEKALEYSKKSLKLSEELGRKEGMAINYGNIGNIYRIKGELDKALGYYEKALQLVEEIGMRLEKARVLMEIGDIFIQKGDNECALEYYHKAKSFGEGSPILESISKRLERFELQASLPNL